MSMYGALFGANSQSDVILAALGLTRQEVGRFRDCGVADDKVYVYTRNGGGNRDCWCEIGGGCDPECSPDSADCHCVGCFMTYHVHKLPHYSHDRDDDYDSTYATIWFDFPPEYADALAALDSGEKWDPDDRWLTLIDSLKKSP